MEQCNEKANRLKLIRDEVDQLRGPMEEAVEFLKNENKAVGCRNFIYQKNMCVFGNFDMKKRIFLNK